MKKVDIIIPVHNRPEHTKQTLESLLLNTDSSLFNLYIVDDGSDMQTFETIMDVMKRYTTAENPKPFSFSQNTIAIGPGASRNEVCEKITAMGNRSEYLYHSDNDVYFTPGWLEKLINTYTNYEEFYGIKVLGGSCHPYLQNKSVINDNYTYRVGIKDAVSGYSQLMTWETWDTFGPFDETMRGQEKKIMGSEDWAFCQKIIKDGFKVGSIEPEVVIPCGRTNTYGDLATGAETFKQVEGVMVK